MSCFDGGTSFNVERIVNGKRTRTSAVLPSVIKTELRRRVGDASRRLRTQGTIADEQIHNVRKDLKRARAGLRLLRALLGKHVYAKENAALRDAARPLSEVRDAKVLMDTLEEVFANDRHPSRATVLRDLHGALEKKRHDARQALHDNEAPENVSATLQKAWTRIDRWRLSKNNPAGLAAGLARLYRSGRKALARAESDPTAHHLHEWRKQVKYLLHALEMLHGGADARVGKFVAKLVKRADATASALGDDHDLVVLHDRIAAVHAGSHNVHRALSSRIEDRRRKLQEKALKTGRPLYKLGARAFVKRLEKHSRAQEPARPGASRVRRARAEISRSPS